MTLTKEKDFIEIDFVGRIKETNQIFDLTNEELAKKEGLFHEGHHHFGPKVICLGFNNMLPALDKFLVNKEVGKDYSVELQPEQAFGKKDVSLVKTVSLQSLRQQNINPFPGLQLNASGALGTVKSVAGGRVTIDFNHPLASKTLVYEIKIHRTVADEKLKLSSLVQALIGLHDHDFKVKLENKKADIKVKQDFPKQLKEQFISKIKEVMPDLEVSFSS